jgi:hypothetical protein
MKGLLTKNELVAAGQIRYKGKQLPRDLPRERFLYTLPLDHTPCRTHLSMATYWLRPDLRVPPTRNGKPATPVYQLLEQEPTRA